MKWIHAVKEPNAKTFVAVMNVNACQATNPMATENAKMSMNVKLILLTIVQSTLNVTIL